MERLVVYGKLETNFTGYGLAILENAKDTHVREKLNGEYALSFALPVTDPKWQHIAEENLVKFEGQMFIIREIQANREGLSKWGFVEAEHVFFMLLEEYIEDRRAVDCSAYVALNTALEGTPFTVGVAEPGGNNTAYFVQMNPVAAINRIIERWGGELHPNNWEVDLLNRRGADRGVQLRYRKNLKNIKRLVDTKSLITRLYVYGKDGLTIESVNSGLKYIDSPNIGLWRRPKCAEIKTDIEDPVELLAYGQEYLAKHDTPFVNYELTVLELKVLSGYGKLERFWLGDDVRVIDDELGIDIKARIIEYDRYYKSDGTIDPSRSSVVLANFRPGIEDEIGKLQDARQIVELAFAKNSPVSRFWLENIIDVLQTKINSAQSNWHTDTDGNLIFAALDGSSAMKLAGAGFAIADQKDVEGNWIWRTFGTGQGFTADLLNAGKVRAEIVEIGANTSYEPGYDPNAKETPAGAQAKADAAVSDFVTVTYNPNITNLQSQIDGKIYTWFANTDPNTWAEADRPKHDGDLWYKTDTKELFRYDSTSNAWQKIEDQTAIDAFNAAANAQDTADGKRRVFTTTPAPPYDIGDLWAQGTSGDLMRCEAARASGAYNASDWRKASKYTDDSALDTHNINQSPHGLPAYVRLQNDGLKCFDTNNVERARFGSWDEGSPRYGMRVLAEDGSTVMIDDRGILQTWQEGRADNIDASNPLVLNIYLPPETKSVHKALLRFRRLAFRAYETGAASGGGHTTPSGGGHTSSSAGYTSTSTSSGGGTTRTSAPGSWTLTSWYLPGDYMNGAGSHNHGIPDGTALAKAGGGSVTFYALGNHVHSFYSVYHVHDVTIPNHQHDFTVQSHSHDVQNHAHTVSNHTHGIVHGIYLGSIPTTITIKVNGNTIGSYSSDQTNLDIKNHLNIGQWNTVELSAASLGRIDATVFIQAKMGV